MKWNSVAYSLSPNTESAFVVFPAVAVVVAEVKLPRYKKSQEINTVKFSAFLPWKIVVILVVVVVKVTSNSCFNFY